MLVLTALSIFSDPSLLPPGGVGLPDIPNGDKEQTGKCSQNTGNCGKQDAIYSQQQSALPAM